MGEVAELMMEGVLCSTCGVFLDDFEAPGHPRECSDCKKIGKPKKAKRNHFKKRDTKK